MPMPIDLLVEYTDGTTESFYIPLRMMSFERKIESCYKVLNDWAWAYQRLNSTLLNQKLPSRK
jgi:hypothetical protein